MSKINQALLTKLTERLGVTSAQVYHLIKEIVNNTGMPRHLAAIRLAGQNGLSMQKYATKAEMMELGGYMNAGRAAPAPAVQVNAPRRPVGKKAAKPVAKKKENTVFVVHGRDRKLCNSMYDFLSSLGLKPKEWGHAIKDAKGGANPYINDAVTSVMEEAQAVVVLLSPDDDVKLKDQFLGKGERASEGKLQGQPRPNVLFELGMALGAHHKKTLIVRVGKVKKFTDIDGMHILNLDGSKDSRNGMANRLEKLGCTIDRTGDYWLDAGNFTPTGPKDSGKKGLAKKAAK